MPAAYKGLGYHELNAMLNLYGPSGEIQFEADREAAHQYLPIQPRDSPHLP